jgi:hypothetical protein
MVRFDHHRARLRRLCLILPLVPAALLGGCAAGGLGRAVELTGVSAPPEGFETARREPLNARAHIETGLQLLARG